MHGVAPHMCRSSSPSIVRRSKQIGFGGLLEYGHLLEYGQRILRTHRDAKTKPRWEGAVPPAVTER